MLIAALFVVRKKFKMTWMPINRGMVDYILIYPIKDYGEIVKINELFMFVDLEGFPWHLKRAKCRVINMSSMIRF